MVAKQKPAVDMNLHTPEALEIVKAWIASCTDYHMVAAINKIAYERCKVTKSAAAHTATRGTHVGDIIFLSWSGDIYPCIVEKVRAKGVTCFYVNEGGSLNGYNASGVGIKDSFRIEGALAKSDAEIEKEVKKYCVDNGYYEPENYKRFAEVIRNVLNGQSAYGF